MFKKLFGLLIVFLFIAQQAHSIAVAPLRLDINANKAKKNYISTTLDIQGESRLIRLKIYSGYFKLDEKGDVLFLEHDENNPYDISKKIRFVPSEFNILPGRTQKVRINIPDIRMLPDGESRAILFVENVDPKEISIPTGSAKYGAALVIKTRMGIPIYVDKGNFHKKGEIEYFNVIEEKDGKYAEIKINSKGNSKIRYDGKIMIIQNKKLIDECPLTSKVVAGGTSLIVKEKLNPDKIPEAGKCTLKAVISYDDEKGKRKNLVKEKEINIQNETL